VYLSQSSCVAFCYKIDLKCDTLGFCGSVQILKVGGHVGDRDGLTDMTLLHYACKSGARGMGSAEETCQAVNWLLRQGADPYTRCRWTNMAAIHYAAYFDVAPVAATLLAATKGIGQLYFVLGYHLY